MGQVVSGDVCLNDDSCGVMQRDCRTFMAFSAPEATVRACQAVLVSLLQNPLLC